MIKRVTDESLANSCDILLNKLILDERKYDKSINDKYIVKDHFKKIIENKDNILLVKVLDEAVVGYVYLRPIKNDLENGYLIDGLYVEEEYRNKGIAKELINSALDILKNYNLSFIDINVMYDNEIARKIYKYFGFKEFKIQMRKS